MRSESTPPSFEAFCRWVAATAGGSVDSPAAPGALDASAGRRYEVLIAAARRARYVVPRHLETLRLLAAADRSAPRPPEMATARGFLVSIAYDEGAERASSLCVLVRCPLELVEQMQGETVYLWSGTERFELGQFDADGKAIGTLPAGIEITLSDLSSGRVRLDEPPPVGG